MTGTVRLAALVASAAIVASMGIAAQAKTKARHHHYNAYASAAPQQAQDPMAIRQQCFLEANKRWPSSNQEMQTVRWFAYSTCAAEHGIYNP
jgi:hypothetical protein